MPLDAEIPWVLTCPNHRRWENNPKVLSEIQLAMGLQWIAGTFCLRSLPTCDVARARHGKGGQEAHAENLGRMHWKISLAVSAIAHIVGSLWRIPAVLCHKVWSKLVDKGVFRRIIPGRTEGADLWAASQPAVTQLQSLQPRLQVMGITIWLWLT